MAVSIVAQSGGVDGGWRWRVTMDRREMLRGMAPVVGGLMLGGRLAWGMGVGARAMDGGARWAGLAAELARIEGECGGRLGVAALDVATGESVGHREGERFPMCSTSKAMAVSALLARVDAGRESLGRVVRFGKGELVGYSPVTETRVGAGMTLGELCEAAMTMSDNAAENLILGALGQAGRSDEAEAEAAGPAAVTGYVRSLGDRVTRFDRTEPTLNTAIPGDPRDTTEPMAMVRDVQAVVLGRALSGRSRGLLTGWMVGCKTGGNRLRAGLPAGWRVGDKTGSGDHGTTNDLAVIWPESGGALVVAAYLTESGKSREVGEAALAAVGRAVAGVR